jgi:hypothetical protein
VLKQDYVRNRIVQLVDLAELSRCSTAVYLPMRLAFGDASWLEPGGYPLPIQTSRILLYGGYFFIGVAVGAGGLRAFACGEQDAGLFAYRRRVDRRSSRTVGAVRRPRRDRRCQLRLDPGYEPRIALAPLLQELDQPLRRVSRRRSQADRGR